MYSYFFLVSLLKCPSSNLEDCAIEIGNSYRKNKLNIIVGKKCQSNSSGYGVGEQENLIPSLLKFTNLFPGVVLAFHHFYWNCSCLTIYTVSNNSVYIDKHSLENITFYEINSAYSFSKTQVPNNITYFFEPTYKQSFDITFLIGK